MENNTTTRQTGETVIHFKDENKWNQEDYKDETPQLNNMVNSAVNNAVIKIPSVVGTENSVKYRYKNLRKKLVKFHGNEVINKKIIKDVATGITIPKVPLDEGANIQ